MERFVCIHGHFYQPPRENPFTGEVQDQPAAHPYRNWNERINAESYTPNLEARILDEQGNLAGTVNNYGWISFDVGPTLLSWLQDHAPDTYRGIIDADRQSMTNFAGHGSAMAQSYNHTILPLSTDRDKRTQVKWGIADFKHRFGRDPDGMWLPEAAVDTRTLEILSEEGIAFTVLSPYQAVVVDEPSGKSHMSDGSIDSRVPYFVETATGNTIAIFFYDGPLSQQIAFNGLLEDGHRLAGALVGAFGASSGEPVMVNVATDGETFGHHHKFGEMALATAIETLRSDPGLKLTNYATYLASHPPRRQVRIAESSSWSCSHGVERWRSNCGCSTGGEPGWNQEWRGPLRDALDWMYQDVSEDFETSGQRYLHDPWAARDDYIEVLLGGSRAAFLERQGVDGLAAEDEETVWGLLEIQHRAMLMYTSCGWFFNDIAGLESTFVLRQAGRVIELMRKLKGHDLEPGFLRHLDRAVSNRGVTGREIFATEVAPFMLA